MFTTCTNCGTMLPQEAAFCSNCGAKVAQQFQQYPPNPQFVAQQQYPPPAPPSPNPNSAFSPQPTPPPSPIPNSSFLTPNSKVPPFTDKQTVLHQAPWALNRPDRPWEVVIEGDAIVARWKWMDATFFAPHEITDETRQYTFTVILGDKGKWKEIDKTEEKSKGMKMSGGTMSFGSTSSSFVGKSNRKSFEFGAGKNNQTGQVGLIGFKFDTNAVKQPIRDYLTGCGWRK